SSPYAAPSQPSPSSPYAASPVTTPPTPAQPKDDPAVLMQQARDLMAAGKLDDASKLAYRAKAATTTPSGWGASWQLFAETPERLIKDINKAKYQRDQEDSWRVLAEGRKLLETGDLEGAS